ncbi:MAG TPA: hypothetical protein VFV20_06035 [Candidatus Limnocylindria bacterium]|nr:hypothetical protein [Candidatus Limnocylindria bacterium]
MAITEVPSGAVVATLLGFLAAAIVLATVLGVPLPLVNSERRALVGVVAVGFAMCVAGGWATERVVPAGPTAIVASLAGILSIVVLLAVVNGWTTVLDPVASLFYGTNAIGIADRVGVLAVGVLIAVAWIASTLRQVGLVSAS